MERLALAAFVLCGAALVRDAWSAVQKSVTRLDPGMAATIGYLRGHREQGPVLSFWDRGYELQRYAACATASDGLLESEVNQRHIVRAARAFLAPTPDSLAALCDQLGIHVLVVPPRWYLVGEAMAAGDPLADRVRAGLSISPEEARRVTVIRMMLTGGDEPPFRKVFETAQYRVYVREPGPARDAARAPPLRTGTSP